jgi:hypothetical protein
MFFLSDEDGLVETKEVEDVEAECSEDPTAEDGDKKRDRASNCSATTTETGTTDRTDESQVDLLLFIDCDSSR